MNSPWGEISVADAHVHFFSKYFFAALAAQKPGVDIPVALGWESPADLAARWVEELDRHGVEKAALIASVPNDEVSVQEAVTRYPSRFYGYFMCNPGQSDALSHVKAAFEGGLHAV